MNSRTAKAAFQNSPKPATLSNAGPQESLTDGDEGSESTLIEDEIMLG